MKKYRIWDLLWILVLLSIAVLSISYWENNPNSPIFWLIPYVVGFFVAVLIGDFATKSIVDLMWDYMKKKEPLHQKYLERYEGQGRIVGIVERVIYYGVLLFGQAVFIPVWLTLKTVSRSPRWGRDAGPIQGRGVFQPFLVGSGISIIFSGGGFLITEIMTRQGDIKMERAISIVAGLFIFWTYCFFVANMAIRKLDDEKRRRGNVRFPHDL